jgi:hypothetical protein
MANQQLTEVASYIDDVVMVLTKANVAIPVVTTAIIGVVKIIKALGGSAPPMAEIIEKIKVQARLNNERGEQIIAQLEAEIRASGQS